MRESKQRKIAIEELVPGERGVLISGNKVPADGELIEGKILVSEAILTGEEEGGEKLLIKDKNLFMGNCLIFINFF